MEFAEKYRSLRVQAPIRHKVLRGIKMSVVNICNRTKKLMNGRDSFLRESEEKMDLWSTEVRIGDYEIKYLKGSKLRNVVI